MKRLLFPVLLWLFGCQAAPPTLAPSPAASVVTSTATASPAATPTPVATVDAAQVSKLLRDGSDKLLFNKPDEAVAYLEEAYRQDPESAEAHYWLFQAYSKVEGMGDRASAHAQRLLEMEVKYVSWRQDAEKFLKERPTPIQVAVHADEYAQNRSSNPTFDPRKLRYVIEQGSQEEMRQMLAAGLDPNSLGEQGRPILCLAVHNSDRGDGLERVQMLLDSGADPNKGDSQNFVPLHWAVTMQTSETHMVKVMKLLIERGAKVNTTNTFKQTPMQLGNIHPNSTMGRFLLSQGGRATMAVQPPNGLSPEKVYRKYMRACETQDMALLNECLMNDQRYDLKDRSPADQKKVMAGRWAPFWSSDLSLTPPETPDDPPDGEPLTMSGSGSSAYNGPMASMSGTIWLRRQEGEWRIESQHWSWYVDRHEVRRVTL